MATSTVIGIGPLGSTITAYAVAADGQSGAVLGDAAVSDSVSGAFTLKLSAPAAGWVRIVARGGKVLRGADNTTQPVDSMELVTPFVTTTFNALRITPATDIAARSFAFKARSGASLADAFKFGMLRLLQLDAANSPLQDDTSVYFNILKGAIVSDVRAFPAQSPDMIELIRGIERFGILFDLPPSQVTKAIAAAAESNYTPAALDGAGSPILVGTWVGGAFNYTQTTSMKALMANIVPDDIKVTDGGLRVAPGMAELISRTLIMDVAIASACQDKSGNQLLVRYPYFALDASGAVPAAACSVAAKHMLYLNQRMLTNNSYKAS